MKLLTLALAATIATSGTTSAATFYFQEVSANDTVTFSLDTAKENYEGLGFDYGQTSVTTNSGSSTVDVGTFFGYGIQGSPAFSFAGSFGGGFISDDFSNTAASESFNLGTFSGQGADQLPATLTVSATPFTSAVSAAPEPGSWALLLGGVGILGAMLRAGYARRREDEVKSTATA